MEYKLFSTDKRSILDQCVRCGICLGYCPVYRISRFETDSPRGKLILMKSLVENKVVSFNNCKNALGHCLFCLQCQRNCPAGVEFDLSFFRTMELLGKKHNDNFKNSSFRGRIENLHAPSLEHLNRIEEKYKGRKARLEEIMIFPGCFIELKEIEKIQAVLKDKGIDAIIFLENSCCGLPYLLQGTKKEALRCMNENLTFFNKIKIKKIITPCPFCLKVFTDYYPFLLNQTIDIEFEHICSSFSSRELKFTWKLSKKVAYHSPCLLDQKTASNHQQIIKQLAGDSYISLPEQICCGHGIGMQYLNEKISRDICQSNLSKIMGKGIQVLITDCPSCTNNWIKGLKERNQDLTIVPFWDLISNLKNNNRRR